MKNNFSNQIKPSPLIGKPNDWFSHIVIVRSDVKREYFPTEEAYISEQECILRSEQIAEFLEQFKVRATILPANDNLAQSLVELKPDLCINFVDSIRGSLSLASGVPGIFDLLNLPYVGAGTLGLSINSNKFLSKTLLENADIPTPRYQLFQTPRQELEYDMRFPLIVKLNEEHGSVGMANVSVVTTEKELHARASELLEVYKQPVLVEEFIDDAREITGVVVESTQIKSFLSERVYEKPKDEQFKLLTFETKWATDLGLEEPVSYTQFETDNKQLVANIKRDLRHAFDVLRMDDYARFDIMVDKYNNYYFIDCNANPTLGPESSVARAARANNQKFETILIDILKRNKLDLKDN